jgi:hypothetical protein
MHHKPQLRRKDPFGRHEADQVFIIVREQGRQDRDAHAGLAGRIDS